MTKKQRNRKFWCAQRTIQHALDKRNEYERARDGLRLEHVLSFQK